jgi:hypothetical protein
MTRVVLLTDKIKKTVKTVTYLIKIKDLNDSVLPSPDLSRAAKAAILRRKVSDVSLSKPEKNPYNHDNRKNQLEDQPNEEYTSSTGNIGMYLRYGISITTTHMGWSNGARFCMVNKTGAVTVCGDVVRIEAKFVELASL